MGVPFGHNTAFGFGEETIFGTGVHSTSFLEINSEGLKLEQAPVGKPKLTGVGVRDYVLSKRGVTGPVSFALPYEGAETILKHITGGTPTSNLIGTWARRNTFPLTANRYPGLTLNIGRDTDEMTHAFQYTGCQPTKFSLKSEIEDHLMIEAEFVGRDEVMIPAEVPSYPEPNFVNWNDAITLTLDGVTVKCRSLTLDEEDPAADDRYSLLSRLRHGLGRGGERKVSGKIELEFEYGHNYINFRDQEEVALVATWNGPEVEPGINYELSVVLPRVVLSGTTPNATEMGPIVHEYEFQAFEGTDGTDEMQLQLVNTVDASA